MELPANLSLIFASSAVSNSPSVSDASLMRPFANFLQPLNFGVDTGKPSRAAQN
jgi:hypothetical protein